MTKATSPFLNRRCRTEAEVWAERYVRDLMWGQANRDRAIAKWQEEAKRK